MEYKNKISKIFAPFKEEYLRNSNVRLIYTCKKQSILSLKTVNLINKLQDEGNLIQIELPPLNQKSYENIKRGLAHLKSHNNISFIVNDYGTLFFLSKLKHKVILGRVFTKTFNKLPENLRVPKGKWITFDVINKLGQFEIVNIPFEGEQTLSFYKGLGVIGIDLDLPVYLNISDIKKLRNFELFVHLTDTFMALGEYCVFSEVHGKCDPTKCNCLNDTYQYIYFDENKLPNTYEPHFFYKGKSIFMLNKTQKVTLRELTENNHDQSIFIL